MLNDLLLIVLKSSLTIVLLYIPYLLLLHKESFFRLNRLILVSILLLSLVMPFCEVKQLYVGVSISDLTYSLEAPFAASASEVPTKVVDSERVEQTAIAVNKYEAVDYLFLLSFLYVVGVVVVLTVRVWQLVRMSHFVHKGCLWKEEWENGITIYCHAGKILPHSWMRKIVINKNDYENHAREILIHEKGHIIYGHSWDIVLLVFVQALQWYNPFVYALGRSLRAVHEYEIDDYVLRQGLSSQRYQELLLKMTVGELTYPFANNFNRSIIKQRIAMMKTKKTQAWMRCKALYTLPVIVILFCAFSAPEKSGRFIGLATYDYDDLPKTNNLNRIFYCYDGKAVTKKEFLSLVQESDENYEIFALNKHLKASVGRLNLEVKWYDSLAEEIDAINSLLRVFGDEKILTGALVAQNKMDKSSVLNMPIPLKWFPRHEVESLDDVLLVCNGQIMKRNTFLKALKSASRYTDVHVYGINQNLKGLIDLSDIEVTWASEEDEYMAAIDYMIEYGDVKSMNGVLELSYVDKNLYKKLDKMLLVYDDEVVETNRFLELLRNDCGSEDVLYVVPHKAFQNDKLQHRLGNFLIAFLQKEDEYIQKDLYYDRTQNEKAKNGVLMLDKNGPEPLMEVDGCLVPYPMPRVNSLEEVLLICNDVVMQNVEEFLAYLQEHYQESDEVWVINKNLYKQLRHYDFQNVKWLPDNEDLPRAQQIYEKTSDPRALNGVIMIVKR